MMQTMTMESTDKSVIKKWVRQWGSSASEAIFDFPSLFFITPDIDGFIGYRIESKCALIFGDPVCALQNRDRLAEAFHKFCQKNHLNPIYMIASEGFVHSVINSGLCKTLIEVGEELFFDPRDNPREGPKGNRLRNKISHAQNLGLKVHEYQPHDPNLEAAILRVGKLWLKGRHGPQIYLGHLDFFEDSNNKRWFYVKDKKHVIGMALLSRLEARQGWLLKFLISVPDAPRGTSELLMISILETLRHENCHFLTYGMVPGKHLGQIKGLGRVASWIAQKSFKISQWVFGLEKRQTFWQKFHPHAERSFMLFGDAGIGFHEIKALTKAFKIDYKIT